MKPVNATSLPEYNSWASMKTRCLNANDKSYSHYGGRGISICPEWLNDFWKFYAYIGPRPTPKHTLDRINNSGHYEPGNVRWSTNKEQSNNRNSNRVIEYRGEHLTMKQWAERIGIHYVSLRERLARGKTLDAILGPKRTTGKGVARLLTANGETRNLKEWADHFKMCPKTLRRWIDRDSLTIEEIQNRL
jgi:hypothetical protein